MAWFKRNPFFFLTLLVLFGGLVFGLWMLSQRKSELAGLKAQFETQSSQYQRYLAARPSPTTANLEAVRDNYEELYEIYQGVARDLNLNTFDREAFFGEVPQSRADWSFRMHRYREGVRDAARRHGVALPAEASFGFDDIPDEGPPSDEMERVHQQTVLFSEILRLLFSSSVPSFVTAQRGEVPQRGRASMTRRLDNQLYNEGSRFVVDSSLPIADGKIVRSELFRVAFRGQTAGLRRFLNKLVASPLPFVVRGVEVAPIGGNGAPLLPDALSDDTSRSAESAAVPIIAESASLFLVTIEVLQLEVEIPDPQAEKEGDDV